MNERSISQNYIKKQEASWIDDPFQIGINAFKGLVPVSNKTNLSNYTQYLVDNRARYDGDNYLLFVSELPEYEQNELVRLYLETIDRDTSECIYGNDFTINNEFTCSLLAMLKDDCRETRDNFAQATRTNILNYYTESLQSILDIACTAYHLNMMNENGYYATMDMDNGNTVWGKY